MRKELEFVDPKDLIIIGLDTLDGPENPLYDERVTLPLDENLVRNIMVYGVQQPVLIQRDSDSRYVVDGRQRTRAAREAAARLAKEGGGTVKIPVRDVQGSSSRLAGIMVSTNELRQGDEILVKAAKAARMLDLGADLEEVSIAFGRSISTINNWLTLLKARPEVHEAVKSGVLSVQAGVELAKYSRDEQLTKLEELKAVAEGSVSVSLVQKQRVQDGASSASGSATPVAGVKGKKPKGQVGVKRTWLRKALGTQAAKRLTSSQYDLLNWISTGYSEDETWYTKFAELATAEMRDNPPKRGRKPKSDSSQAPSSDGGGVVDVDESEEEESIEEEGEESDDDTNPIEMY